LCDVVEEASVSHGPFSKGDIVIKAGGAVSRGVGVRHSQKSAQLKRIIGIMLRVSRKACIISTCDRHECRKFPAAQPHARRSDAQDVWYTHVLF
jgi:hypothetical protein